MVSVTVPLKGSHVPEVGPLNESPGLVALMSRESVPPAHGPGDGSVMLTTSRLGPSAHGVPAVPQTGRLSARTTAPGSAPLAASRKPSSTVAVPGEARESTTALRLNG